MKIRGREYGIDELLPDASSKNKQIIADAMTSDFAGWFPPDVVQELLVATGMSMSELMLWLGSIAKFYAYVPISNYQVGAVSLGATGALYYGCNLEFTGQALSFVTHAEQSAVTHARYHGETGIQALAISAAPCGYCRQFLNELRIGANLVIYLSGGPTTLGVLLPDSFGPGELGNKCRLMDPQDHQLTVTSAPNDPVTQAATAAANTCYAPYTQDYSGVGLMASTGQTFGGSYEENVAYNPSMSPMEAALVALNFSGLQITDVSRAVLVENVGSKCNQEAATRAVLASIAPAVGLEYYTATSAEISNCLST